MILLKIICLALNKISNQVLQRTFGEIEQRPSNNSRGVSHSNLQDWFSHCHVEFPPSFLIVVTRIKYYNAGWGRLPKAPMAKRDYERLTT